MNTPVIRFGESRMLVFPVFDFNGQVSSTNLTAGDSTLTLGTEGWWAVYGVSATLCLGADGALVSPSNVNIQISDVVNNKFLFTYASNWALTGAPIEHVAGKYGNPAWLGFPRMFAPGSRLMLYASQTTGSTPSVRSPMYVVLHAVLCPEPIPNQTLGSFQHQASQNHGLASSMTTKFVFSGATSNNLLVSQSRTNAAPINRDREFFIDSITARSSSMTSTYINTVDPRYTEPELLFNIRDSVSQSAFCQPGPAPLALFAGIAGSRSFRPPTHFHINANADIVATLINKTQATISTDLELTLQGTVLEK